MKLCCHVKGTSGLKKRNVSELIKGIIDCGKLSYLEKKKSSWHEGIGVYCNLIGIENEFKCTLNRILLQQKNQWLSKKISK